VHAIIPETCQAIWEALQPIFLPPMDLNLWNRVADGFMDKWQFPNCLGAIDGKHIRIKAPPMSGSKFYNYKGFFSIVLLGAYDAEYKFIFVDIGKNGRAHDSTVFRESPLGIKLKTNTLNLPQPSTLPGFNINMPYVIIGDDAFTLHTNLMKPYPERDLTQERRICNYRFSRARRISENAFGILANRFRVLLNPIALNVEKVETYACVLLHNYLLSKKELNYIPVKYRTENLETLQSGLCSVGQQGGNRSSIEAGEVRDMFAQYFNTTGAVPWQYAAVEKGNC